MHITIEDEVTNKKTVACVNRELQTATILRADDWATLQAAVATMAGMEVPRVYLVLKDGFPVPPGFVPELGARVYVHRFGTR